MIELCYSAYPIAYFFISQDITERSQKDLLENIYINEYIFLHPKYKNHKKIFFMDVMQNANYLIDQDKLDKEFPAVAKDFSANGLEFDQENLGSDFPEINLFFMILRLRILYLEDKGYVRMKLRTLLKHYGHKRRSAQLNEHFRDCLMFYHIQPYLKNNVECDIREIDLDDMVTFRVL